MEDLLNEKYAKVPMDRHWDGILQAMRRHMSSIKMAFRLYTLSEWRGCFNLRGHYSGFSVVLLLVCGGSVSKGRVTPIAPHPPHVTRRTSPATPHPRHLRHCARCWPAVGSKDDNPDYMDMTQYRLFVKDTKIHGPVSIAECDIIYKRVNREVDVPQAATAAASVMDSKGAPSPNKKKAKKAEAKKAVDNDASNHRLIRTTGHGQPATADRPRPMDHGSRGGGGGGVAAGRLQLGGCGLAVVA